MALFVSGFTQVPIFAAQGFANVVFATRVAAGQRGWLMNVSTEVAEGESTHVAGTGRGTQPEQVEPGTGLVPSSSNNSISAVNGVALNSGLTGASVGTLNPGAACAQAELEHAIVILAIVSPMSNARYARFK